MSERVRRTADLDIRRVSSGLKNVGKTDGPSRRKSSCSGYHHDHSLHDNDVKVSFAELKQRKLSISRREAQKDRSKQPKFGICFDIDGVLARGTIPIPASIEAFKKLVDENGQLCVPAAFVTNALNKNSDKATQISGWLGVEISPDQMIQSPCPLELFTDYHDKLCLVVGQGKIFEIVKELGFTNMCTIEDIADAYPLLDMVDHDNRKRIAAKGYVEKDFPRIEAILLLGEPKRWESALQILVDLLRTDGKPNQVPEYIPSVHLPVIACNMDLQFMDRAALPRYGHGAFLVCLESLYEKVTGFPLQYSALVGKPSEITFRYAEHVLTRESRRLGYCEPVKTMYLIGDSPEVDIVGCNLYQHYIDRLKQRRLTNMGITTAESELIDPSLPDARNVPRTCTKLCTQTVDTVVSLLVCTGVHVPGTELPDSDEEGENKNPHRHRDIPKESDLHTPTVILDDVNSAIDYILEREQICFPL